MKEKINIEPYFQTDLGILYCGDCLEIMPQLQDDIGLILTDPPYGINHPTDFRKRGRGKLTAGNDYAPVYGDNKKYDPQWLLNLNRPLVLWGANHYADKLPSSSGWLVWDKLRPDSLDQSTCELAWTNCVKGVRRFKHLWHGMMRQSEKGENYHPTQKPVALMVWCLSLKWLQKQNPIVDPYFGTGPVGVACERINRKWIGIEISEKYCEIAKNRIKKEISQPKIWSKANQSKPKQLTFF